MAAPVKGDIPDDDDDDGRRLVRGRPTMSTYALIGGRRAAGRRGIWLAAPRELE